MCFLLKYTPFIKGIRIVLPSSLWLSKILFLSFKKNKIKIKRFGKRGSLKSSDIVLKVPPEGSILDITEDQVIVALKKPFRFDKIFDENSSQEQVYHSLIRPMVDKVSETFDCN